MYTLWFGRYAYCSIDARARGSAVRFLGILVWRKKENLYAIPSVHVKESCIPRGSQRLEVVQRYGTVLLKRGLVNSSEYTRQRMKTLNLDSANLEMIEIACFVSRWGS